MSAKDAKPMQRTREPRRKLYVGPHLRREREALGLSQAELARRLELSPSYLNQIERNHRPLSATVLLRLRGVLGLEVRGLGDDEGARLLSDLGAAVADPAWGEAETFSGDELRDLVAAHPGIARTLVALHRRAVDAQRRVEEMAAGLGARLPDGTSLPVLPYDQVLDFVYDNHNHFPALDEAAERLADEIGPAGEGAATALARRLAMRHGVRTVEAQGASHRRRLDRDRCLVELARGLSAPRRAFQLAVQLALIEHSSALEQLTAVPGLSTADSRALARIGLANYFAGAVLLPYGSFLAAAEETGYDIGLLGERFGVSIETVCHRLSTLQRPGRAGVPFVFIRVDRAGNISKRHSATDFHFSRVGGNCPLWNVYEAFSSPGRFLRQIARMPQGRTYLWIARTVERGASGFDEQRALFALGLGCDLRHADRLVYARGLALNDPATAVPIGPGCRLCERESCPQRAVPLVGRPLDTDEDAVGSAPYPAR
jgi:XRE family transcriptional regulator, fatty acid utilization regulator